MLLAADQQARNYWITVVPQYRVGAPSGFGVLSYDTVNVSLPTTPAVQGSNVTAWSLADASKVGSRQARARA